MHVGRGASDIDYDQVAQACLQADPAGEQLGRRQHGVGRRHQDHGAEVGPRAEVLPANDMVDKEVPDRFANRPLVHHPDLRHQIGCRHHVLAAFSQQLVRRRLRLFVPGQNDRDFQPTVSEGSGALDQHGAVAPVRPSR